MAQWFKKEKKILSSIQEPQETWVQSLGWEDPLRKEMATQSSILAWRIPWTQEPVGLQSMGSKRVRHNLVTKQTRHEHMLTETLPWPILKLHQLT